MRTVSAPRTPQSGRRPLDTGLVRMVGLTISLMVASGCAGGNEEPSETPAKPVPAFDSDYCGTAREWAVHEFDGSADGAYERGGPTALKTWWDEQLEFLAASVRRAPSEVREAETVNERDTRTRLTPLLEKYDFDFERFEREATAAEQERAGKTPRAVVKAQRAREVYQNRECGYGGSPPPADVTFAGGAAAKSYCRAAAAQQRGLGKVVASAFDPATFRTYVTSDGFLGALGAQDATAPPEIAADVTADNAWVRDRKLPLLASFDYDLRRLMREGSAAELAVFTYWDPLIIEQDSRVSAYVAQVCHLG